MTSKDSLTELKVPVTLESNEQKIAYQDFINVLSAILVKYSASLEHTSKN